MNEREITKQNERIGTKQTDEMKELTNETNKGNK